MVNTSEKKYPWFFWLILLVFIIYGSLYIYLTSFVVNGQRHFVLFDDAMISMQYAKNFVQGHGLVWSIGDKPVEGFTNPLWVGLMVIVHLLPISLNYTSLVVQFFALVFLTINLFVIYKIAHQIFHNQIVASGSVLLTALFLPLVDWSLKGMEVSLIVLLVSSAVLFFIRAQETQRISWLLYVVLWLGLFVRLEFFLVVGIFVVFLYLERHRSEAIKLLAGAILVIGLQLLAQRVYYGDFLPATYYLKMTGYPLFYRISRGAAVYWDFIFHWYVWFFIIPFALCLFRPKDKIINLILALFIIQSLYSIWVGGDAWENGSTNRYVSIIIPLYFVLLAGSLQVLVEFFGSLAKQFSNQIPTTRFYNFLVWVLIIGSLVHVNIAHDKYGFHKWLLLEEPSYVSESTYAVELSETLRRFTTSQASVTLTLAGAPIYFSDRKGIDILGKNDMKIAKEKAHFFQLVQSQYSKYFWFWPGHLKWDYEYSIFTLKPDVVSGIWKDIDRFKPRLYKDYYRVFVLSPSYDRMEFFVRKDSPNIIWSELSEVQENITPPSAADLNGTWRQISINHKALSS